MNVGEIIAGAIGGIVAAAVLLAVLFVIARRGRRVFAAVDAQLHGDTALQRKKAPPD